MSHRLDRAEFVENYLDELSDNLIRIDAGMMALKKDPESADELNRVLRALHTVKGSSRMLGFGEVERVLHGVENLFKGAREGRYAISSSLVQLVFFTTGLLREAGGRIRRGVDSHLPHEALGEVYERVYAGEPFSLDAVRSAMAPAAGAGAGAADADDEAEADRPEPAPRMAEYDTVRVKLSRMEDVIRLFNNLILTQFQLKGEVKRVEALEGALRAIASPAGGEAPCSGEPGPAVGECLRMAKQIKKNFSTGITLLERNARAVQEALYGLRMLPLELILAPIRKMVADLAISFEKEIDCRIEGGDIMLDKAILEKLHDPLIHIVRNAADHGLEPPAERRERGKPAEGRLWIACRPEGGGIRLRVRDDGRGINYERIREKAMALHPVRADEIAAMDPAALNGFIFSCGFSTAEKVSEISGRGVGMDIVRENIEKIKGRITLDSAPGAGTEFVITLPPSLATVEGFFVKAADRKFLVPANFVREIVIADARRSMSVLNRQAIEHNGRIIPIYPLGAIVDGVHGRSPEKLFIVVVESLGEIIGVVVDEVLQYVSLIYKPLPANLAPIRMLQGVVFDEFHHMVTILFMPEVMNRLKRVREIDTRRRFSDACPEYKRVLMVDDSFSARQIGRAILEAEHYNVVTAADGIEGLEKLRESHFHLIITDIKMPRMDGLTFLENIRRDERYRRTPVIVVSSVDDPETRRKFAERGADAFIVKSEFDRGNLIQEVKARIGGSEANSPEINGAALNGRPPTDGPKGA